MVRCLKCKKEIEDEDDDYSIETPNLFFPFHLDCAIEFEGELEDKFALESGGVKDED